MLQQDPIVVRQSLISTMLECPAKVGYRDTEGYQFTTTEKMLFGTVTHKIVADVLTGARLVDVANPENVAIEYERAIENEKQQGNQVEQHSPQIAEICRATMIFFREVDKNLIKDIVAVEQTIEVPIGTGLISERPIHLQGTPDIVTPTGGLDVKTTGAQRNWSVDIADTSLQASIYEALTRPEPRNGKWAFIVYSRREARLNTYYTIRDDENVKSAIYLAHAIGQQIDANVFPGRPYVRQFGKVIRGSYCNEKWCPAWNICSYKDAVN